MTNNLATTGDGFDVPEPGGGGLIVGQLLKFNNGAYFANKTEVVPLGTTLVVVAVTTLWIKWENGRPAEHRVTRPGQAHPVRDDLPDQDQAEWKPGFKDQLADPWKDSRYLHLVDPQTGADYTFVTDSYGGRKAIGELKSQITNVRFAHPGAVPTVRLASTMMPTDYGPKPRPSFKVIGWKNMSGSATSVEQKQITAPAAAKKRADYDDEIPF
jgi:hypothetical protein